MKFNNAGSGNAETLYRSDGTLAGTYQVAENISYGQKLKTYKGALWFQARNTGSVANVEPWRSGGNAPTTNKAFEIEPAVVPVSPFTPYSSTPYGFFTLNNDLYFWASTSIPSGHNLYKYTGDFTFNGSLVGGRWSDSANWNGRMPPGITDTVYINSGTSHTLQVDGAKAYAGVLNMGNNANINLLNATDTLEINHAINTGLNNTIGFPGTLALKNLQGDTVRINGGFEINNINVQSAATILSGTIVLYNKIDFTGGKLLLNNHNFRLRVNTTTTATSNGYFVTNGTGAVLAEGLGVGASQQPKLIPIGTPTDYAPVTITNTGDADNFTARVIENSYSSYTGDIPAGQPYTTGAVKHTWFINEGVPGASNVNLALQWNQSQELPSFDRSQTYLGHYTSGAWNLGTAGTAAGLNPYTFSRTGITSFSPFGISNNNITLPLRFLSFSAQKCGGNVCLNWKTADEQSVSHFEIERSIDGRNFTSIKKEVAKNQSVNLYTSTDDFTFLQNIDIIYYRIKQVDADGKSTYSAIVMVRQKNIDVDVFPTVFLKSFTLQSNLAGNMQLQVYSVEGRLLHQQVIQQGINIINPKSNYKGVLIYRLINNEKLLATGKLISQ
jgi:hypothetical protein